jgi:hypothetical protein
MRLRARRAYREMCDQTRYTRTGHLIDVWVTIAPVKRKDGKVLGASVVAGDITSQRQVEEALRRSEERCRVAVKEGWPFTLPLLMMPRPAMKG